MAHLQTFARRNISTKMPLLYVYDAAHVLSGKIKKELTFERLPYMLEPI